MKNQCDGSAKQLRLKRRLAQASAATEILEIAYDFLGNPILLHDMDYRLIGYTKNTVTDDPIWNEHVGSGTVTFHQLTFFQEEHFLDAIASSKKSAILASDKLNYLRVYGKLFSADQLQVGCACMVVCDGPFEEGADIPLFELVCDALTRVFSASPYFRDYAQRYFEKLIGLLIEGIGPREKLYCTPQVESIYISLGYNLHLIVLDGKAPPEHAAVLGKLRSLDMPFKLTQYAGRPVLLASTRHDAAVPSRERAKLLHFFKEHRLRAGISHSFDNLFDLPKHYREAAAALAEE